MELAATIIPDWPHEKLIAMLNEQIHEQEVNRIMNISNREHAFRSAAGSLLLSQMVSRISGYPIQSISIHRDSNGKPFLPDFPNLHFNISHTDHLAVVAVDTQLIGVDIERLAGARMPVAKRFFSPGEQEMLLQSPSHQRDELFFNMWTARESFVKAIGIGIFTSMDHYLPEFKETGWEVFHSATGQWKIKHYRLMENYIVAVCSKNHLFPEKVEMVDFMKLFEA